MAKIVCIVLLASGEYSVPNTLHSITPVLVQVLISTSNKIDFESREHTVDEDNRELEHLEF